MFQTTSWDGSSQSQSYPMKYPLIYERVVLLESGKYLKVIQNSGTPNENRGYSEYLFLHQLWKM